MRLIDAEPLEEIITLRHEQCINDYGSIAGAINGCLKLLKAQPTITPLPNDPLTLSELREMDGKPVWNDTMKQWAIVDANNRITVNVFGHFRPLDDRYYLHKLEEEIE